MDGTLCRCPSHLTHLLAHASSWEAATSTQGGEDVAGVEHFVAVGLSLHGMNTELKTNLGLEDGLSLL